MLQLKKNSSCPDKAFPVSILLIYDLMGDVPVLTCNTVTENERCNTRGEMIQLSILVTKHIAPWSTVPVR